MSGTTLTYDDATFRTQYPFFGNATAYPAAALQNWFTLGTAYISDYNAGIMQGAARQSALYMMTAHLQALSDMINADAGAVPGLVVDASVDKVKVTITPPPAKNQWQYWLGLTPWGQMLLALLQAKSAGGWSVGGNPERLGFRRVAGRFGGRGW